MRRAVACVWAAGLATVCIVGACDPRSTPEHGTASPPTPEQAATALHVAWLEERADSAWGPVPGTAPERRRAVRIARSWFEQRMAGPTQDSAQWSALWDRTERDATQADSYAAFAGALTRAQDDVADAHATLRPAGVASAVQAARAPGPFYYAGPALSRLGACLEWTLDGELVVSRISRTRPGTLGLRAGDRIVGFDGHPWERWVEALEASRLIRYPPPAGTPEARQYFRMVGAAMNASLVDSVTVEIGAGAPAGGEGARVSARAVPEGAPGLLACARARIPDGLVDEAGRPVTNDPSQAVQSGRFASDGTAYVLIRSLAPGGATSIASPTARQWSESLVRAFRNVSGAPALIIDLRVNGGGLSTELAHQAVAGLIPGPDRDLQVFTKQVRDPSRADPGALLGVEEAWADGCVEAPGPDWFRRLCRRYRRIEGGIRDYPPLRPDDPDRTFEGPIEVLTGPNCVSACDMLVHVLARLPGVEIVGREPAGSLTGLYWPPETVPVGEEDIVVGVPTVTFAHLLDGEAVPASRQPGVVDQPDWYTSADLALGRDGMVERSRSRLREKAGRGS